MGTKRRYPSVDRRDFLKAAATTLAMGVAGRPVLAQGGRTRMSDVIVLLPGIMGSVLRKDGRDVWAVSGGAMLNVLRTLGGSLRDLRLTGDPADVDDLSDGITADRIVPDTHLVPGFWKIDGYSEAWRSITSAFDVEVGRNFFEFPYDWRRDNRVAARKLARATHKWLKEWQSRSGNKDAKLIFIAHSMGGLVCRYFLEPLEGWKQTRMLVTFGTPYRGSLNAVNFLVTGYKKNLGSIPLVDLSSLLSSFTSVHQLLPTYPCYDAGDGKLVRVGETAGIPNLDFAKAAGALAFHQEITSAVDRHARDDSYVRGRYSIHPIIGIYQPTLQVAKRAGNTIEVATLYPGGADIDGDGTVPRPSAIPLELDGKRQGVYVAERHGSLQNAGSVLKHVNGLLSEGAIPPDAFRDVGANDVRLLLDDAYVTGEPITIQSVCRNVDANLRAVVIGIGTNSIVARANLAKNSDGVHHAELAPLPEGTYRLTINGSNAGSVTDVFMVAKS